MDDIAGWDFFDDDNDPQDTSSYFAAENHGTGRAEEAVERGNDGQGSIGVCPKCQYVPMRIWDTFVSDQNNFFLAVTYAADNGVKVILGADGGLYHSEFAEKASRYAYEKGVAQLYSGDDLNTGNHNYPAAYNHAMLVQGVSADAEGLGEELPEQEGDPGFRDQLIALLDTLGAGHDRARGHLLPQREHHPVRRQVVDLDARADRLDEHRQGRGRRGADPVGCAGAGRERCHPTSCAR